MTIYVRDKTFYTFNVILPLPVYFNNHWTAELTLYPPNYSIEIFIHLKLCLADAIHNFKWVKIQLFSNRADWCHIMALTCLKGGTECGNNWVKNPIYLALAVKGLNSLNFHALAAVPRYHNPKLQVREKYSYLLHLRPKIFKSWSKNCYLNGW